MYDTLVWTVMSYGIEIWGWKERKGLESIHERFLRWTMGLDWRTPSYLVREELKREMMCGRAEKRAWKFEKRLEEGKGAQIAKKCWREMKERWKRGRIIGGWEQERKEFLEEREIRNEEEELDIKVLEEWENTRQKEERRRRIKYSTYNDCYKEIMSDKIPKYLKKGWTEKRWKKG